jgi:hypothetical protein
MKQALNGLQVFFYASNYTNSFRPLGGVPYKKACRIFTSSCGCADSDKMSVPFDLML